MPQTAILELGNPRDANAWERGCQSLGIGNAVEPIKTMRPSLDALLKFLKSTPDWIFFSGHFLPTQLYDDGNTTSLVFAASQVTVTAGKETRIVKKGEDAFGLDRQCKVVVWGGCSVCGYKGSVDTLRSLFGPHLLLGYSESTGFAITEAMLGGGFIKKGHFFDNVKGHETDSPKIRDAWLQAAINGYRGGSSTPGKLDERMFRAIDPDGKQWWAAGGKIKPVEN